MAWEYGGISGKNAIYFFVFIFRYILFEPFRLLEVFIFDHQIRKHQLLEDPIFILGHWRSGTSHLQHLLSKDGQHTTTTIYKSLFSDIYLLTEGWLKKPLNWVAKVFSIPFSIQRMPLHFDLVKRSCY